MALGVGVQRFDKEARVSQIDQLRRVQRNLSPQLRPTGHTASKKGNEKPWNSAEITLTGIHLIDTDAEGAEMLSKALPDHEILQDEPLPLIAPTVSDVHEVESALDLWHLDAIGLTDARADGFRNTGAGVGVAVLDTGIADVAEIRGKVKVSYSLNRTNNRWTTVHAHDTYGHGTHVAGLVAGSLVGVAPGAELTNVIMIREGTGGIRGYRGGMRRGGRGTGASLPLGGRRATLTSWITETENPSDPFWSEGVGKRLSAWSWV